MWSGVATVHEKKEWPDWYPTADILQRKPEIRQYMVQLQSGSGMHGGPDNPLGARALYRIHGTNEPDSIGHNVSSGCIRMGNEAVVDLYDRTPVGTKVIVLAQVLLQKLLRAAPVWPTDLSLAHPPVRPVVPVGAFWAV